MTFDEWFEKNSKDQMKSAFNAGFEEGFREGVKSSNDKPDPTPYNAPITTSPFPRPFIRSEPFFPKHQYSCSKCGLLLDGVMGYVCPDVKCPTFKQPWSGTITSGDTGPYSDGSSSAGTKGSSGSHIVGDIKR